MDESSDGVWTDSKKFLSEGGLDFLELIETEFDCASMCKTPLFYMTRSIEDGMPEQDCLSGTLKGMGKKGRPAAIVALITALLLFIAMVGAFPLCTGFKKQDD
jgi:hypothetical protein